MVIKRIMTNDDIDLRWLSVTTYIYVNHEKKYKICKDEIKIEVSDGDFVEIKQKQWFFLWRWLWNILFTILCTFACDGNGLREIWARTRKLGYLSFKIEEVHDNSRLKIGYRKSKEKKQEQYKEVLKLLHKGRTIKEVHAICKENGKEVSERTIWSLKKEFYPQKR